MRLRSWLGMLLLISVLAGCAGPHEQPNTADLIFPIPWLIKRQNAGTIWQDMPAPARPAATAPAGEGR